MKLGNKIALAIGIAAFILLVIFIAQNAASATVRFMWVEFSAPLSVFAVLTFLVGVACGAIYASVLSHRKKVKAEKDNEQKKLLETLKRENLDMKNKLLQLEKPLPKQPES